MQPLGNGPAKRLTCIHLIPKVSVMSLNGWPDGDKIRELRKQHNLKVTDLAERVGIARQYLSLIELGRRKQTSLDTICGIARELGEPLDNLVIIATRRDDGAEAGGAAA